MILRLAVKSAARNAPSWLALIISSVTLAVVLTLNIALIISGAAAEGEGQQAFIAMGGTALGFSLLTGLASFVLVVSVCVRLQRRDVALWQIAGLSPRSAFSTVTIETLLLTLVSAALGAVLAVALWPAFAGFVSTSGLPQSDVLNGRIPIAALIIGVASTAVVTCLAGVRSSRAIVNGDIVESVKSANTFEQNRPSVVRRIVSITLGVGAVIGVAAIYVAISNADPVTEPRKIGEFLTTYSGMGMLLCLVFALFGGPAVRLVVWLGSRTLGRGLTPFLATREASARPRLTRALIMPLSLAAASTGVMTTWVDKLRTVLTAETGSTDGVSAPPEQIALLLGGPIIVACVASGAIVFATATNRQQDNALLLVAGATSRLIYRKALGEALFYAVISLVCAYAIICLNEVAMVQALSAGPIPNVGLAAPSWHAGAVIAFGVALTLIMLLVITVTGLRKHPISTIQEGH